ncbi:MAG: hypothetical protein M3O41_02960 [Pseudomonadota bacterium]|nr:hypothetical protein [Pseudomonadota bacterium]
MLFSAPARAVGLCLMLPGAVGAASPAAAQTASGTAPTAVAPAATVGSASDAAARHAKRTECLKEAKAKKLVGADKSSFLKDCTGAH